MRLYYRKQAAILHRYSLHISKAPVGQQFPLRCHLICSKKECFLWRAGFILDAERQNQKWTPKNNIPASQLHTRTKMSQTPPSQIPHSQLYGIKFPWQQVAGHLTFAAIAKCTCKHVLIVLVFRISCMLYHKSKVVIAPAPPPHRYLLSSIRGACYHLIQYSPWHLQIAKNK